MITKGDRIGKLITIKIVGRTTSGNAIWKCKCDCGTIKEISSTNLGRHTKSCGCLWLKSITKHGLTSKSLPKGSISKRLFSIWSNIQQRCENPKASGYKYYGAKNIRMCSKWRNNFKSFYEWALLNGYQSHLTIDRRNSKKDYRPKNCRWITLEANARRVNHK